MIHATLDTPGAPAFPSHAAEYTSSSRPTMGETLRELWSYREVLFFLTWRDITIRYRQTVLGALWAVLQPFITMVVFTVLFGVVVKMPTNNIPAPIFYFSALLPWLYFSGTMNTAGNSLVGNADLIKKVYFPRLVLPASGALLGLVDFGIGAALLTLMIAWYDALSWRLFLWIPLILLLWTFSFSIGVLLSAINVKYRDVKHAIPFLVQIWMFLTPVIYPASVIPKKFGWLIHLNPLSGIIEAFRATTVSGLPFDWGALGLSLTATVGLLLVGVMYFRRVEGYFTDII
jgi:lipopolysaccharide transport system permease protein